MPRSWCRSASLSLANQRPQLMTLGGGKTGAAHHHRDPRTPWGHPLPHGQCRRARAPRGAVCRAGRTSNAAVRAHRPLPGLWHRPDGDTLYTVWTGCHHVAPVPPAPFGTCDTGQRPGTTVVPARPCRFRAQPRRSCGTQIAPMECQDNSMEDEEGETVCHCPQPT